MKIENVITAPNVYLTCYKVRTFAIAAGDWFTFDQLRSVNTVYTPVDVTFSAPISFYNSDYLASINHVSPNDPAECVLRNTTKKVVIRFSKHPNVLATEFLANYSFGVDLFLPTSVNAVPHPLNALAKDGDELEIYGLPEIRKFFTGPVHANLGPVPYLLTVAMFH